MDNLDFLDGPTPEPAAAPEPVIEQALEPVAEAAPGGPERGPDGKFVAKAPEAPQAPEPAPAAMHEPVIPPGYVPVSVVQELRKDIQALRQQPQAPPPQAPDRYDDPEGYELHLEQRRRAEIVNVRLDISEEMARSKHGDDVVTAAQQWALEQFEAVPGFREHVLAQRNPYEFAVQEHQRQQLLADLTPDDLAQFKAWKAGSPAPGQVPVAARVAAPQPPTPPRSLAAALSAGGTKPGAVPAGPGEAFNAVFKE